MIKILNVKSLYSALYQTVELYTKNKHEEIEIIVPDKLSLFMEKFLFEHMNITSSFNIKVSTLNRFAKKSCVVEKEKMISKTASIILIHKILNDNINNLEVLKSKAYSFSYAEEIFKTVGQLKASKISFEEMKKFESKDNQLNRKIKDLALVYEQYEIQKAGLLDASDLFLMSSLYVANGKENKKILFVGFDDFTAIEYAIIERLAVATEVNIFNYYSNEKNKYIYNNEMFSQLKNIAYINGLNFEVEDCFETKSNLKNFLENNLYSLENNNFVLNEEIIKIYSGNNIRDEVEFVARDIRNRILNGQKFNEFGVFIFGLENNERLIKDVFEKYEINYYVDNQISFAKSVLFKFFVQIFKYNFEPFNLSHIIDLINSPFFLLDSNKKRIIIKNLIAVKFKGKIGENLNLNIDEKDKSLLIDFFKTINFDKNDDVKTLIVNLRSLNIDDVLNDLSQNGVDNKVLISKSKEIIFSIFDDILKFYPDTSTEIFYDIFSRVASVVKINNLPLKLDCVKIVDANNSMEIFDELYVVGATKENAPNLKYDCGIILDNEIEALNFSHKLNPTISHINKLARLRLFNSVLLFEKELTLTYSNSQSDIIKDLTDKIKVETEIGEMNIVPISKFGYDKYVAMSKWDYIDFVCKNKSVNNQKNYNINENIVKNKEFLNISNKNLNIYNEFNVVSATTLENYFKCPFYAFLNNILKIKPDLDIEILSLDIGNVLHEIMYVYYKKKKAVGDIYEFCRNQVFKCVEREERLKLNIDSPIITNLIDEAVRVVNAVNYIDENSLFEPKYFEYDFRDENALKLKNISIAGKIDRVDIYNDMFRIVDYKSGKADASLKELYYGNKLQLFLYSCAMENVLKKKGVGSFYLPLHNAYTKELSNTYSMKGFYLAEDFVVRAFDKRLQAGNKSDIVNVTMTKNETVRKSIGYKELESEELTSLKNYSKVVSENAVDEIKSGYIKPSPSEVSKPCEFCPYNHVCLKNANNITYRKADKINLESFKEVSND